ncbi:MULTISPECIES: D-glycero-beta-D-manno-heptose-7-phosphate kinase [unclassified Caulobacter]|uniref:D-glycero-beta-D-manno-heptose-7-phosphate kinase n=1 Tax=unclassified Caulobacter TaxID=2648921 RepID=UPI0006F1ECA4|nr:MULTISPECIES: D-glycero-beta-D-manno-heptose-7-phosphate kinase [unclassified Caulobacter]KQV62061.1 D-beta-D-heptose 1-phosphate adenosyltransferase [Caulobacter sp. Root342]KQV64727.1 D-beta-D-heptose 1-phosphate adenosyltransferase [Caulobacter sp. Root343]
MTDTLADLPRAFAGKTVLVLGDVMLDRFIYGAVDRISPEAPVPVIAVEKETAMLGGAGNVARNVAALGAMAVLIGLVGQDDAGAALRSMIDAEPGLEADLVIDAGRRTTEKVRYISGSHQMLRVDREDRGPGDGAALLAAFKARLAAADVVVLSDYAKGVLTAQVVRGAIDAARAAGKPVIVDPKSRDLARYDGATLIKPNRKEAAEATGIIDNSDEASEEAGGAILAMAPGLEAALITRGGAGMTLAARGQAPVHLPATAVEVFDVSGAGDTVAATLALAVAAGASLTDAARLANLAGGLVVAKLGTDVVTAAELAARAGSVEGEPGEIKIADRDHARRIVEGWRARGLKVGFTNGCFDLLHPGHVSLLSQAKAACDRLIVGLNTDASVSKLKGPSRPVQKETARATVLASLSSVDLVVLFDEDTPLTLIEAFRPDVLVKGADYTVETVVGSDVVLGYGGKVVLAALKQGQSTTALIGRMNAES